MATETILLAERAPLTVILVHLVAGDDEDALQAGKPAAGLQEIDRAHDVGREGCHRVAVGFAHEGLRRHMDHDLRIGLRGAAL